MMTSETTPSSHVALSAAVADMISRTELLTMLGLDVNGRTPPGLPKSVRIAGQRYYSRTAVVAWWNRKTANLNA